MSLEAAELARCNNFASLLHLIEASIISVAYFAEFLKGSRTLIYTLITLVFALSIPIAERVIIKSKPDSLMVKHLIGYGFGAFYVFISLTTTNKLAFVYVIPLLIVIMVYNDYKYIALTAASSCIVNIIQVIIFLNNGTYSWKEDSASIEIQVLVMILISFYMIWAGKVMVGNNKIRLDLIEKQAKETEDNMQLTRDVSNSMFSVIQSVTEKVEHLNETTITTRENMGEINAGAGDTAEAVQTQLSLTDNIQHQVESVKDETVQITESVNSASDALTEGKKNVNILVEQVAGSIKSGKAVADELENLQENMANVHSVIEIINNITSQTGLLALNASIEAARAGEAGKGFAVVASEISKMADETAQATTKIQNMLNDFSATITNVVDVTGGMIQQIDAQNESTSHTADSFDAIENSSAIIAGKAAELSREVNALAKANAEIVDSISTISSVSEEVSAHANSTYEASENNIALVSDITEFIEELNELAAKLKNN